MYDLVSIGNISVDVFFKGKSLTFENNRFQLAVGGKYFVDQVKETVGGGGLNVAVGAARHGLHVAVLGTVGQNGFKPMILNALKTESVSDRYIRWSDNYINISSILLSEKGERTIIHYSTASQKIIENKDELLKLARSKIIYLGNLPEATITEKIRILHFLNSKSVKTVVNLGVKDCRQKISDLKELLVNCDILIINGHEFSELVKSPYKDIHFKDNVISWYAPWLTDKTVVITEGAKGSYAYHGGKVYHHEAYKINNIVDTTGAGDAFTSGFITGVSQQKSVIESMSVGARYAAKILIKIGAI